MRQRLEKVDKAGVSVVGNAALAAKVVVVGRDELGERNAALRSHLQQVHQFAAQQRHLRQQ